jgi:3-phenylpropionate/cinnamic acid dioxygenase small subunit
MEARSTDTGRALVALGGELYHRVVDLLYGEAELLDQRRHHEWLAMLTDDVVYRMPVRVTSPHTLDGSTLSHMSHFDEDRYSLEKRVARFDTEHAWAEDPPSRTRRHVSNIRVWEGDSPGDVVATSSILLFRSRGDVHESDLISAGRTDVIREVDGRLLIARRDILVDESVLRTQNLAIFL